MYGFRYTITARSIHKRKNSKCDKQMNDGKIRGIIQTVPLQHVCTQVILSAISSTSSPCSLPSSTCSPSPSWACSSWLPRAWQQPSCWRQASLLVMPWLSSSAKLLQFYVGLVRPSCPSWACKLPPPPHHRIPPRCQMQQQLSLRLSSCIILIV